MKLIDESRIPEWLRSPKTARIFLTIRQAFLILFVCVGILMLIMVSWMAFLADPSEVDCGDGERPSWGWRLFAIGFVLVWNIGVIAFLRENTKLLRRMKVETGQP